MLLCCFANTYNLITNLFLYACCDSLLPLFKSYFQFLFSFVPFDFFLQLFLLAFSNLPFLLSLLIPFPLTFPSYTYLPSSLSYSTHYVTTLWHVPSLLYFYLSIQAVAKIVGGAEGLFRNPLYLVKFIVSTQTVLYSTGLCVLVTLLQNVTCAETY